MKENLKKEKRVSMVSVSKISPAPTQRQSTPPVKFSGIRIDTDSLSGTVTIDICRDGSDCLETSYRGFLPSTQEQEAGQLAVRKSKPRDLKTAGYVKQLLDGVERIFRTYKSLPLAERVAWPDFIPLTRPLKALLDSADFLAKARAAKDKTMLDPTLGDELTTTTEQPAIQVYGPSERPRGVKLTFKYEPLA